MLDHVRKLPPLNAVRAFEAAARHVSFTKAAAELHVTHGAISRHVSLIEEWAGRPLFRRTPSHLLLTEAGRAYCKELTVLLDRMSVASLALQESAASTLRVNAHPTFTMRWLIPRMSGFQRRRPDVEIRLTTSLAPINFQDNAYDLAIRHYPAGQNWSASLPFMTDIYLPVCHVDLIQGSHAPDPDILKSHTLLSYATKPNAWSEWLTAAGMPDAPHGSTLRFEQLYFAIEAAEQGLGVVVAPLSQVLDEIITGKLVAPFGLHAARRVACYASFVNTPAVDPVVQAFFEWLQEQGRDTERSVTSWSESMGWVGDPYAGTPAAVVSRDVTPVGG